MHILLNKMYFLCFYTACTGAVFDIHICNRRSIRMRYHTHSDDFAIIHPCDSEIVVYNLFDTAISYFVIKIIVSF